MTTKKSPKKNPIHGIEPRKWFDKKWVIETTASGPPVVTAAAGAIKAFSEGVVAFGVAASFACVWLCGASVLKVISAKRQDAKDDESKKHDGLKGALHVLHAVVAHAGKLSDDQAGPSLRATFHRVVPPLDAGDYIEQVVDYVGGKGGGCGRKFHIRTGITGKAIRDRSVFIMERQSESYEDYRKELVSEWGYTEHDVKEITSDRYSAIAVPVQSSNGQDVLGVIYLDCDKKNFFASNETREAVIRGSAGVIRYIGERYG